MRGGRRQATVCLCCPRYHTMMIKSRHPDMCAVLGAAALQQGAPGASLCAYDWAGDYRCGVCFPEPRLHSSVRAVHKCDAPLMQCVQRAVLRVRPQGRACTCMHILGTCAAAADMHIMCCLLVLVSRYRMWCSKWRELVGMAWNDNKLDDKADGKLRKLKQLAAYLEKARYAWHTSRACPDLCRVIAPKQSTSAAASIQHWRGRMHLQASTTRRCCRACSG